MSKLLLNYEHYKNEWHNTKPIRGRVEDCRPIGQRRRTWETIEKREINGEEVYACHLYQTDVVMYYPDGSIGLRCGSWATPITAEFMHMHSPFYCYKKYNQLWAKVGEKAYPIPEDGELRLYAKQTDTGALIYEPKETIMIKKRVVDRVKAKEARMKIQGFMDWAKTFNKLSDGWISHDTRVQFGTYKHAWWRAQWDYGLPKELLNMSYYTTLNEPKVYEYLQTCDDEGYMRVYLAMFGDQHKATLNKTAKVEQMLNDDGTPMPNRTLTHYDMQFDWTYVQGHIYKLAEKAVDIYKEVEVPVGDKAVTRVVG